MSGDDGYKARSETYKKVFGNYDALKQTRQAEAQLYALKQKAKQPKLKPESAWIGKAQHANKQPQPHGILSPQINYPESQELLGALKPNVSFTDLAKTDYSEQAERLRAQRVADVERERLNGPLGQYHQSLDSLRKIQPGTYDPNTKTFVFKNPDEVEHEAQTQLTQALTNLVTKYSKGKDLSPKGMAAIVDYLSNDMMASANEEGIIDGIVNAFTNPGSHLAGFYPSRFRDAKTEIADEISESEAYEELTKTYAPVIAMVRTSQGLKNSLRSGKANHDGTFFVPLENISEQDIGSDISKAAIQGSAGFFSQGAANFMQYVPKNGQNSVPSGTIAQYLKRPTFFVEPGNTTNEDIKANILSRLDSATLKSIEAGGLETDPTLMEMVVPAAADLVGSLVMGGLKAGGTVATKGIALGKAMLKDTKTAKRVGELATRAIETIGKSKIVETVNKTAAGRKLLGMFNGLSKHDAEAALHTFLTFNFATLMESGDELTDEELLQSVESGTIFPLTGVVAGQIFSKVGQRAARLSKTVRTANQQLRAIEKGSIETATAQDAAIHKVAIERVTSRYAQAGFLLGQIPANVVQGEAVRILTDPNHVFWDDRDKVGVINDVLISAVFGPKWAKAHMEGRKESKDFKSVYGKFVQGRQADESVHKEDKFYSKMDDVPVEETQDAPFEPIAGMPIEDMPTVERPSTEPPVPKVYEYSIKEWQDVHGGSTQGIAKALREGRLRGRKEMVGKKEVWTIESETELKKKPAQAQAKGVFDDMPAQTTVRDIAPLLNLDPQNRSSKVFAEKLETVGDVPVEITDGDRIYYDADNKKIIYGRGAQAKDLDFQRKQMSEEIAHAMTVDILADPEVRKDVERVRKFIHQNPKVQERILMDRVAARSRGYKRGRLTHFLKDAEEFTAAMITGDLSDVAAIVDTASGEGIFSDLLRKTKLGEATIFGKPLFMTPESIDNIVAGVFGRAGESKPIGVSEEVAMSQTEETMGLDTWRGAIAATGKKARGLKPEDISFAKELTDIALATGIPEQVWVKIAKDKFPDYENMPLFNQLKHAVEEATIQRIVDPKSELGKLMESIESEMLNTEANEAPVTESQLIRNIGSYLGFTNTQNARKWVRKSIENLGFEGTYDKMVKRFEHYQKGMPKKTAEAFRKGFDRVYSQLMLASGWTDVLPNIDVRVRTDDNRGTYLAGMRMGEPRAQLHKSGYQTAMKMLAETMTAKWNKPVHGYFMEELVNSEIATATDLKKTIERLGVGREREVEKLLYDNGWYMIPKGYSGSLLLNLDNMISSLSKRITGEHGRTPDERALLTDKEKSKDVIKSLEDMLWFRQLQPDSRWPVGDKIDFSSGDYKSLDLHKLLDEWRTHGKIKSDIVDFFLEKGEQYRSFYIKNEQALRQDITKVARKLDALMMSSKSRMQPLSSLFDQAIDKALPGAETQNPDVVKNQLKWAFSKVLDQLYGLTVDPGAKSFHEDGKMGAKYLGHMAGTSYHAFKDMSHVDAVLKWTGRKSLDFKGEPDSKEGDDHRRYLESMGLHTDSDGMAYHKVLVINDDQASQIPELEAIVGKEMRLSKAWDGASFYINPETEALHAEMLGNEASKTGGVKFAWYGNDRGHVNIWKTAGSESLMDLMKSLDDAPHFAMALDNWRRQGISMVTIESALKSDGSFRYRHETDEDGSGSLLYNDKGRVVGEVTSSGEQKKYTSEDIAAIHKDQGVRMLQGDIPQGSILSVPLTGENGLRLLTVSKGLDNLNGVAAGINNVPSTLPGDIGYEAYKHLSPVIANRNQRAAETFNASAQLVTAASKGSNLRLNLVENGTLADVYDEMRSRLSRDESPLGETYSDPESRRILLDRFDALVDAQGTINVESLQAFDIRFPGIFSKVKSPHTGAQNKSMLQLVAEDAVSAAKRVRYDGSSGLMLQPMAAPKHYLAQGQEYLDKLVKEGVVSEEEGVARMSAIEDVLYNGGLIEDGRGGSIALPPFWAEDGTPTPNSPYVFVTQDYLDLANRHVKRWNSRNTDPTKHLDAVLPGAKVVGVLTPTDSLESNVPLIIAGVMPGVGRISGNNETLIHVLGRDNDGDKWGLAFKSEVWIDSDGRNRYDDFWSEMFSIGTHKNVTKKNIDVLQEGKALSEGEAQEAQSKRATALDQSVVPYQYVAQRPQDIGYHRRAMEASTGIDQAMDLQRRTTSAMRTTMGLAEVAPGGQPNNTQEATSTSPDGKRTASVKATFVHDPEMSSQMSLWKQSLVDPYDAYSYNIEDLFLASVARDIQVDGQPKEFGNLDQLEKKALRNALETYLTTNKRMDPNDYFVKVLQASDSRDQAQDMKGRIHQGGAFYQANKARTKNPVTRATKAVNNVASGVKSHVLDRMMSARVKEMGFDKLLKDWHDAIFLRGQRGTAVYGNALTPVLTDAETRVNTSVMHGFLSSDSLTPTEGQVVPLSRKLALVGTESEAMFQFKDSEGNIRDEVPVSSIFNSDGSVVDEYKAVVEAEGITNLSQLQKPEVYGRVVPIRMTDVGGSIKKRALMDPKNLWINFDNGTWRGADRDNVLWVAKPSVAGSPDNMREPMKLADKVAKHLEQYPDGFIYFNHNYGKDYQAQRQAELAEGVVNDAVRAHDNLTGVNTEGFFKSKDLPIQERAALVGQIMTSAAKQLVSDPVQQAMMAGKLISQSMADRYNNGDEIQPDIQTWFKGAYQEGVIPRHPSGIALDEMYYTALAGKSKAFEKLQQELQKSEPTVSTHVDIPESVITSMENGTGPRQFDTFSRKENEEGFAPTQAMLDALGKSRRKRLAATMEALNVATHSHMTSITPEEYANVFDDVKTVYKTMFDGKLEEKHIDQLMNAFSPAMLESLYQDLGAYGSEVTRRTALAGTFIEIFDEAERMSKDLHKLVNTTQSEFKRRWALRFENFLKWNKQNDEELVRMTSRKKGVFNREQVLSVSIATFNGEPVSITANTVGMQWDPYYRVRKNVLYDALPNVHYLKPHSDIHSIKDAYQVWLTDGSKSIANLETMFLDKRGWKSKLLEDFRDDKFDEDRENLTREMRLFKDIIDTGELDLGDFKIDSEFDGAAESRATISYGGKTFVWNGAIDASGKAIIDDMVKEMIKQVPPKYFNDREAIARSLRRTMMIMAHDKILANYIQSMSHKHQAWLVEQSQHWHSEAEEFNQVSQLVSQNVAKMEELANDLRSDKFQDHLAMTTAVNPRQLGDRLTRYMSLVQSMEPGARDIAYANLIDVVHRAYDQEATDFSHAETVTIGAEKGKNLIRNVLNHVNESDMVFRSMFPNENISTPDYVKTMRDMPLIEAHLNEFLADFFHEDQDYGMENRNALLKSEAEKIMLGINDAMKTAYMHEYGLTDSPIARAAILSRFETKGMYYEQPVDISRLQSMSADVIGGSLTEADHGIKPGESISVQFYDKQGNLRKSNGRFLGVTGVAPKPVLSESARKTAEALEIHDTLEPQEAHFIKSVQEHMGKEEVVPSLLFSSVSDDTQKAQITLVPLNRTVAMHRGTTLGRWKKFIDRKSQEHTEQALLGVAEGLKEVASLEGMDPLKAIAGQITERMVVDPNDRTFATGLIASRQKYNQGVAPERMFVQKMGLDELPPHWRKINHYITEANRLVSRHTYEGLRHVLGVTAGVGAVLAAPLTAVPFAVAAGGLMMAVKSAIKGSTAHVLHLLGNRAGGPLRAYMLDVLGASLGKVWQSLKHETSSSPASAAAIAQRLQAGSQFMGDPFSNPNTSINRPTASIERHVKTLEYLTDLGLDAQVFADKTPFEIKSMIYDQVVKASKHAEGYKVHTVYDPTTGTTKAYLADQDGKSLTELERLNIDVLNQMLTFVDHDAEMTLKGLYKKSLAAMTTGFKQVNKVNTRMFKGVTHSEYEGAVNLSSQLEDSYMQEAKTNELPELVHDNEEVNRLLKVNYIKMMSTEILGKFDEKNPYHTTETGKLATLFSQWTRNFSLQTTKGVFRRREYFREITKVLANSDVVVSERMQKMGIPVMGGNTKSQTTALRRLTTIGALGNISSIARVAAFALATSGLFSSKLVNDIDYWMRENLDDTMKNLNRLVGSDNIQGYMAAAAATVLGEVIFFLNRDSAAATDMREYKTGQMAIQSVGKVATAGGVGFSLGTAERNAEMVALGSYLWAIDATPSQWKRFENDWNYMAESALVSTGTLAPLGIVSESGRNFVKTIKKAK